MLYVRKLYYLIRLLVSLLMIELMCGGVLFVFVGEVVMVVFCLFCFGWLVGGCLCCMLVLWLFGCVVCVECVEVCFVDELLLFCEWCDECGVFVELVCVV